MRWEIDVPAGKRARLSAAQALRQVERHGAVLRARAVELSQQVGDLLVRERPLLLGVALRRLGFPAGVVSQNAFLNGALHHGGCAFMYLADERSRELAAASAGSGAHIGVCAFQDARAQVLQGGVADQVGERTQPAANGGERVGRISTRCLADAQVVLYVLAERYAAFSGSRILCHVFYGLLGRSLRHVAGFACRARFFASPLSLRDCIAGNRRFALANLASWVPLLSPRDQLCLEVSRHSSPLSINGETSIPEEPAVPTVKRYDTRATALEKWPDHAK